MARRPLVVGNWKMNGTRASVQQLLSDLIGGLPGDLRAEVGVCVPFVFIPEAARMLENASLQLGAQNVADQDSGAYTGEISAPMLLEFGCRMAIVGHSERRLIYGESDRLVAARYQKAVAHGVLPILCVGETLEQREQSETFAVIDQQLDAVLELNGVKSLQQAVIAYEPVWAIGTGRTATTEQAQEVHAYIRSRIADRDQEVAEGLRILYGGSVKADNAEALFGMKDVDGGLIGGASLDAKSFISISRAA